MSKRDESVDTQDPPSSLAVTDGGSDGPTTDRQPDDGVTVDDLLDKLESLRETVDDDRERSKVDQTISMVEELPGSPALRRRVKKYTTRDIAEGFVGGIIFSLPLLVEDGVFEIAEWFVDVRVGPIPVFLVINVTFIMIMITGLLYYTDIRDVRVTRPILGFIPRRLVGVLLVSLIVAAGLMFMWGRLHEEDPTTLEVIGRITVIWAAAAFGATLGDILPGESKGEDISELLGDREDRH